MPELHKASLLQLRIIDDRSSITISPSPCLFIRAGGNAGWLPLVGKLARLLAHDLQLSDLKTHDIDCQT